MLFLENFDTQVINMIMFDIQRNQAQNNLWKLYSTFASAAISSLSFFIISTPFRFRKLQHAPRGKGKYWISLPYLPKVSLGGF